MIRTFGSISRLTFSNLSIAINVCQVCHFRQSQTTPRNPPRNFRKDHSHQNGYRAMASIPDRDIFKKIGALDPHTERSRVLTYIFKSGRDRCRSPRSSRDSSFGYLFHRLFLSLCSDPSSTWCWLLKPIDGRPRVSTWSTDQGSLTRYLGPYSSTVNRGFQRRFYLCVRYRLV